MRRLRDGFAFVGITEEWDLSICTSAALQFIPGENPPQETRNPLSAAGKALRVEHCFFPVTC